MRTPSFFGVVGLTAIIVAATGYSFLILGPDAGSIAIPITAIVSVCILLGMTQIMLGYEIRNIRSLAMGRNLSRGPQDGSFSTASEVSTRYPPIMVGDESPLDDFKNAPDPAKSDESERRLEKFRAALRRMGKPAERMATQPRKGRVARSKPRHVELYGSGGLKEAAPTKSFRVSLIGRTEIVLLAATTGEEVKFPVDNAKVLEMAWHAFAKGMKVRPIIQGGRIARLEAE